MIEPRGRWSAARNDELLAGTYVCKQLREHNLLQALTAKPAEIIISAVNINDPDALKAVVMETGTSAASRADRIASATKRIITEKMDEDPAFYKQFSEMLEETIRDYRERRISEKDYLNNVVDLASRMARKDHGRRLPESIKADDDAQAVFGIVEPFARLASSAGL